MSSFTKKLCFLFLIACLLPLLPIQTGEAALTSITNTQTIGSTTYIYTVTLGDSVSVSSKTVTTTTLSTITNVVTTTMIGPIGPTGLTGAIGATGPIGPRGQVGETGAVGATGATGSRGLIGEKGDIGAQGIQGVSGTPADQNLLYGAIVLGASGLGLGLLNFRKKKEEE